MKSRKLLVSVSVLAVCLLVLCAFVIIPMVRLTGTEQGQVDISYRNAQKIDNELILTVSYDGYGDSFEIGKDIVVATDSDFSNPLRRKSCIVEDSNYVYTFEMPEPADSVYIEPPILYVPTEVSPFTISLAEGSSTTPDGTEWFSIESVETTGSTGGRFRVRIAIIPNTEDLPRFPELVSSEQRVGGMSSLKFKENEFIFGEFIFYIPAITLEDAESWINNSSLEVNEALVTVKATDLSFSSNIKTLSIIEKE